MALTSLLHNGGTLVAEVVDRTSIQLLKVGVIRKRAKAGPKHDESLQIGKRSHDSSGFRYLVSRHIPEPET